MILSKKAQKMLCFIPFLSTFVILWITGINFSKNKVPLKKWLQLIGIMAATFLVGSFLDLYIMSGLFPFLNWIVTALVFSCANLALIKLQIEPENPPESTTEAGASPLKKNFGIVLIVLLFLVIAIPILIRSLHYESIYSDTNGSEDFSLCCLTENEVTENEEYVLSFSKISRNGKETEVRGQYKNYDQSLVSVSAKVLDGVYVVQATKVDTERLTLALSSSVSQGNFEVFLLVDNVIHSKIPANCNQKVVLENIRNKTVVVKIAGEGAEFQFSVTRESEDAD